MDNRTLLARALVCLLALAALSSCGGGSGSPVAPPPVTQPPASARAVVTLTSDPDPIIVTATGDRHYPWRATWTAVFRETAGLGASVDFINVSGRNLAGQEFPNPLNYGATRIIQAAGTNHIGASGTLRVPLTMSYFTGNAGGSRTLTLIMTAQIHDDAGSLITLTMEVRALFENGGLGPRE